MKKIYKAILALGISLGTFSCTPYLDMSPTDSVSDKVIWETTENAENTDSLENAETSEAFESERFEESTENAENGLSVHYFTELLAEALGVKEAK